jgi:hypothetical protein
MGAPWSKGSCRQAWAARRALLQLPQGASMGPQASEASVAKGRKGTQRLRWRRTGAAVLYGVWKWGGAKGAKGGRYLGRGAVQLSGPRVWQSRQPRSLNPYGTQSADGGGQVKAWGVAVAWSSPLPGRRHSCVTPQLRLPTHLKFELPASTGCSELQAASGWAQAKLA